MKLYTEKQLEEVFAIGIKYAAANKPASLGEHRKYVENMIQSLTPIELPSDEDIELRTSYFKFEKNKQVFYNGAKWAINWVIEQIKQQSI